MSRAASIGRGLAPALTRSRPDGGEGGKGMVAERGWKLHRVNQCAKCPWRVDVDPHDIPNGYSEELHRGLSGTIAVPGSIRSTGRVMACHEHDADEQVHCVGWLAHQLGPGNNIPLRLQLISCANIGEIRLHGEQHARFEDTLP